MTTHEALNNLEKVLNGGIAAGIFKEHNTVVVASQSLQVLRSYVDEQNRFITNQVPEASLMYATKEAVT